MSEEIFEEGLGFDASSIRGWQKINESDMIVVPQPETAYLDPFAKDVTLCLICNVLDPITREDYPRDPRNVARKAANYMAQTGVADRAMFGPEVEFFVFDDVRFGQNAHSGYYHLDSGEGGWNTGREEGPNRGHKIRRTEGYLTSQPADSLYDLRNEMMLVMGQCGIIVESHHHENASGGQGEVDMRFCNLLEMADNVLKYKYIVKNVARRHGKSATFMPKPIFDDSGSGMHCHVSFWKDDRNLFAGNRYAGLSETAEYAIGGLLRHAAGALRDHEPDDEQL